MHKKNLRKIFIFLALLLAILLGLFLSQVRRMKQAEPPAPFSALTWDSTIADMTRTEGVSTSTYDSVYGGLCYTYPKEYEGYSGTVKYMFDDKDALMSIAWTCSLTDVDALDALYEKITASVNTAYGESGYQPNSVNNYGNVWYLDTGNIVLSVMATDSNQALQYAYLHPSVSHERKG